MKVAIKAIRKQGPARLIVAAPVAAASTCAELRREVDELVVVLAPDEFHAVGQWYSDFSQTSDEEVTEILADCHRKAIANCDA